MIAITFPLPPPPPTASSELPPFGICNVNWEELAVPIILIGVFVFNFIFIYFYRLAAAPKAIAVSAVTGGIFAATANDADNVVAADDADDSVPAAAPKAIAISTVPGSIFAATANDADNVVAADYADDSAAAATNYAAAAATDYAAAADASLTARRRYRSHLAEIAGLDPSDCEGYDTELTDESDNELDALFTSYDAEDAKRDAENTKYYAERARELDDFIASL